MIRVLFRADASFNLGGGHISRCAALGHGLIKKGAEVHFLCRDGNGHLCDWLNAEGFSVIRIPADIKNQKEDLKKTLKVLADLGKVDWIVVDHYELDSFWEGSLRTSDRKVIVIDDLADREHDCDILINQNYIKEPQIRYRNLLPNDCKLLIGPRYALIREGFAQKRNEICARDGQVRNLLICFGATDPLGYSGVALDASLKIKNKFDRIDVVTSKQNYNAMLLESKCRDIKNIFFHCPADNIIDLIGEADLSIGAGGVMNWERSCLGLPSIVFGVANNQTPTLRALIEDGYCLGQAAMLVPDISIISDWLNVGISSPELLRGISLRSMGLVDGTGVNRVIKQMMPSEITFRAAHMSDSKSIFDWRNNANLRAISGDGSKIKYADHERWMLEVLQNPNKILLVAEQHNFPIGVVRFDCDGQKATISIYLIPGAPGGQDLIRKSVSWLRVHRSSIKQVLANVMTSNNISLNAFRSAGFRDKMHSLSIDL